MQFQSETQALTVADDSRQDPREREQAIYYLAEHPSPRGIQTMVRLLEDDDFGVRWVAAVGLSRVGEAALPELLEALVDPHRVADPRLREGAYHVLHYNFSPMVSELAWDLMKALKGSAADITTLEAASRVLARFQAQQRGTAVASAGR